MYDDPHPLARAITEFGIVWHLYIEHKLDDVATYPGKTAKTHPFKGDALRGMWNAHVVDARFLLRNIYNKWEMFQREKR
ncbi:hypothetical protein SB461_09335 [Burkholderia cenocepacia]|uniref:hypothetical protein n=1 Tax=Burkholderia cenocepacia TaxID=95486 RepID=UPI002B249127|nr:hypothetical protein [Burkholderia cenocepacia]MEB2606702.1 hypothetical protein [Burkholderia cenocepacia]